MPSKTYPELTLRALTESVLTHPGVNVFTFQSLCTAVRKYRKSEGVEPREERMMVSIRKALQKQQTMARVEFNPDTGNVRVTDKGLKRYNAMGKVLLPHLGMRNIHNALKQHGWPGHFPILGRQPSQVDLLKKQNVDELVRSVAYLAGYSARNDETFNNNAFHVAEMEGQLVDERTENDRLREEVAMLRAEINSKESCVANK